MAVYFDKKQKTWYVDVRFRDESGDIRSHKKRGFKLKRDAEAYERDLRSSGDKYEKYLFRDMAERYYDSRKGYANDATIDLNRNRLHKYAKTLLDLELPFTAKTLIKWRLKLDSEDISTRTKNSVIRYIKSISVFAYNYYDIYNAAKSLELFKLKLEDRSEKHVMSLEDFDKFIECVENPTMRIYFEFCYFLGTRRSEAKAVLKTDIDLKSKTVSITKSIPHRQKERNKLSNLKTSKSYRVLKMDDILFDHIVPLLKQEGQFLFGGYEPLSNSTIDRHFKSAIAKSKVPPITLHEFRHSNGSLLLDQDVPLIVVSRRLGHSSVDVTARIYAHMMKNVDEKSAEVFNNMRKNNSK